MSSLKSPTKKPVYILVALASTIVFSIYNYVDVRMMLRDQFSQYQLKREKKTAFYLSLGQKMAKAELLDELRLQLDAARVEHEFDFYMVHYKGEPLFWGTADGKPGVLKEQFALDQDVITQDASLRTVALSENSDLTIGYNTNIDSAINATISKYADKLVDETIKITLLALLVFLYYMRDFLHLIKIFKSRDRRTIRSIKTKTRESEILARGLLGYEATLDGLEVENKILGRQVLPSLKKEILSGKAPPYDFECTMVRTDINNFSTIYNTQDVTEFMEIINGFFHQVSHVVSSYKGLIHEFVGDEVIFYFKDEDHQNSFSIALSAIHDINELASAISRRTMQDLGYPFTVKSSLAAGVIRFGPLVNGYSIAGSVLIETVRILSHVVEKNGNVVFFDSVHLGRVVEVFRVEEEMKVTLKGFSGTKNLYASRGKLSVDELLAQMDTDKVALLKFFRQPTDLVKILDFLGEASLGKSLLSTDDIVLAIKYLREMPMTVASNELSEALMSWMEKISTGQPEKQTSLLRRIEGRAGSAGSGLKQSPAILSGVAMLVLNLIPPIGFTEEVGLRLKRFLSHPDKRVVANVLEVLTHFNSELDPKIYRQLFDHDDNRVVANALVQEGMRDLSTFVIKRLRRMLLDESSATVASSLFVIGELALYYRQNDSVYYNTHVEFAGLVLAVIESASHTDPAVRRQCYTAVQKAGDIELTEKLMAQLLAHADPALVGEANAILMGSRRLKKVA